MHTRFYKERDALIEDFHNPYQDFGFMENEPFEKNGIRAYDFLHGNCDVMARFLNDKYGYQRKYLVRGDILIHAWCEYKDDAGKKVFVDARGKTDNFDEFIEEFADWCDQEEILSEDSDLNIIDEHIVRDEDGALFMKIYEAAEAYDEYYRLAS